MKVRTVAWLGTAVDDVDAERAFYRDVLGMTDHGAVADFVLLTTADGDVVELFSGDDPARAEFSAPVPGFLVDDLDSAVAELGESGASIVGEVQEGSTSRWLHLRTPNGVLVELLEVSRPGGEEGTR